ncbi:MAG TPA: hypothetical protein VIG43_01740 [Kurthia sp.]
MTGIIIFIVILAVVLLVLFRAAFKKRQSDDIYSPFDEITTGTKPSMDGHNPLNQTKEKVQQEIKYQESEHKKNEE